MTHAVTILHRHDVGGSRLDLHRAICSCGRSIGMWTPYEGEALADAQVHEDRQPSEAILRLDPDRIA